MMQCRISSGSGGGGGGGLDVVNLENKGEGLFLRGEAAPGLARSCPSCFRDMYRSLK